MRRVHTALLNEIAAGVYDGYTYKEFERVAPEEHRSRVKDKLRYRYPRGESYLDLVQRVKPVAMEIEREKRPTLVIAHQAVLRTIIAFFQGTSLEEIPTLEIPLHTVLKLTITPHGCDVHNLCPKGSNLPMASSSDDLQESPRDSDGPSPVKNPNEGG
jgi:broad specificity phosphatase PhoE